MTTSHRAHPRRTWARILTSAVVAVVLLEYVVLPQVVRARHEVALVTGGTLWLLVVALLLEAGSLVVYTFLTQSTVPGPHRVRWRTQLAMDLTGFAASHVLPGGGTAATALRYRLMTARGIPHSATLSTVAVEATFSDLALLATYCLGVALSLPALGHHSYYVTAAVVGVLLIGATGLGSWMLGRNRPGTHVSPDVEPLRSERLRHWLRRWRHLVRDVRDFLADRERRNVAIAFALGNWLLDAAALWTCLAAFGEFVHPGLLLTAYGAANLLGLLPVTPGGLGVIEGVLMPTLVAFGVGGGAAVIGVLSWRVVEFWLPIPAGGLAYVALRVDDARSGRELSARAH